MKLIKIITISFCIVLMFSYNIFADSSDISIDGTISTGESWMETGKEHAGIGVDTSNLKSGSNVLYWTLFSIATVIAIIVGGMLGIKYMMAGIDEKVQVKESLFPYLISCVVVFGSIGIWKLVVTVLTEIK